MAGERLKEIPGLLDALDERARRLERTAKRSPRDAAKWLQMPDGWEPPEDKTK